MSETAALERVRTVGELMDSAVTIPGVGVDVGLDPVLGLLPVVGDATTALVGLYVVAEAWLAGVSRLTLARMVLNVAVDFALGSVPLVGDVFDVFWRAHDRNADLFEAHVGDA